MIEGMLEKEMLSHGFAHAAEGGKRLNKVSIVLIGTFWVALFLVIVGLMIGAIVLLAKAKKSISYTAAKKKEWYDFNVLKDKNLNWSVK